MWFGVSKAGAIDVPINLANKGHFFSHQINDSEAKAIIIDRELVDRLKFIENDLPRLEKVIVWSKSSRTKEMPKLRFDVIDYEELIDSPSDRPHVNIKASEPQTIIYTSGTTGSAKGVVDPHTKICHSALEYIEAIRATAEDIFFTCLPVFHANARILCIYPAMLLGTEGCYL